MIIYTHIARLQDGLALCSSVETNELASSVKTQKQQITQLTAMANDRSEPKFSITSGDYVIHYLHNNGIIYFCITESKFPKTLVFPYLEELEKEFDKSHSHDALMPNVRPYMFAGFDNFIQKTKQLYLDQSATLNLSKMNADLQDVSKIMSKNIEDLLYRGEKLDRITDLSNELKYESKKYMKRAKRVNLEALLRQYAPVGGVAVVVLFVVWWKLM